MTIDRNQRALLELIKASLFGAAPDFPADVDWERVFEEAKKQTVAALCYAAVPESAPCKAAWKEAAAQSSAFFARVLHEQSALIRLLDTGGGIHGVVLKGCAAAVYYPKPQKRTMGDVDFLIPEADRDRACALLEENGYFHMEEGSPRHDIFFKNGIEIELHRHYSHDVDIEPIIRDGLACVQNRSVSGTSFPMLPEHANGLVLLDHLAFHLANNGLGLRQATDWMMFVDRSLRKQSEWEAFQPLLRASGLETLAGVLTLMCERDLGLPGEIPWCADADGALADELLELLFRKGNFGKTVVRSPLVSIRSYFRQHGLFGALQKSGLIHWEAAKKHAFLRRFAWLYQIFRYTRQGVRAVFRGEARHLKKEFQAVDSDNALVCRLGLESRMEQD